MATYKKQILRLGKWYHPSAPSGVLEITKNYLQQVVENFKKSPFVPVTRGHKDQDELESNPDLIVANNIKSLEMGDDGLYAEMEIDESELDKYNDVSVSIDPDYEDHETGNRIGAMLKHVALVVNPYIKGLKPFVALGENPNLVINLSDINMEEEKKTNPEIVEETTVETEVETEVKADEAPVEESKEQEDVKTEATEEATEETPAEETKEETAEVIEEAKPVISATELSEAEKLQARIVELEEQAKKMAVEIAQKNAQSMYDELLHKGKIVPAAKDSFLMLAEQGSTEINLSDGTKKSVSELVNELFSAMPVMIDFSEKGKNVETGEAIDKVKADLRILHKEMNDVEFEEWYAHNSSLIAKSSQKYKK